MTKRPKGCICEPAITQRIGSDWGQQPFFSYVVGMKVRVHFNDCLIPDEVLETWTVKFAPGK